MQDQDTPEVKDESLQQLIDRLPDLVGHFYNDAPAPHFSRAGTGKTAPLIPPAFTNWRDEQRSWAETAALLHQSHHMPELFLDGPDALRLLERLGINTVGNFTEDRAKQFVTCTPAGHVIGDCIAYRLGPESFELVSGMPLQNWVHYNAEKGGWDVTVTRDAPSNLNPAGRRVKYRFQLDGPKAGQVFAAAIDDELPELKFFRTAHVTIKGHDVLVLRHGMAGHQGVEISGPFEHEAEVREAILAAGAPYGIRPVGTAAYFSTPLSNAWMAYPVPGIFTGGDLRDYREWLSGSGWEAHTELGGSYVSGNIEDYYVTPYDLGYGHMVKFDHDFIGREALEGMPADQRRQKVVLVWDHDDVQRVYASQFGAGPRYKAIEFPVAYYAWNQFDEVRDPSGGFAGVSCHAGYINPDGEMLSLAMLDAAHAVPGAEVLVTWGEPDGGSRKPQVEQHQQTAIRATVAPAPFTPAVRDRFREAVGAR
jgi:glycine cleavage system aminomethyltransferase T